MQGSSVASSGVGRLWVGGALGRWAAVGQQRSGQQWAGEVERTEITG